MIMEHMHLLERRQDRSFISIAQWQLILTQNKSKMQGFWCRAGIHWQRMAAFQQGQNTLKPFVMHICKTCKKQGIMHKCNQIGYKKSFLSIFANSQFSSRFGQKETVLRVTLDGKKLFFAWLWTNKCVSFTMYRPVDFSQCLSVPEFNCSQKISNSWTQKKGPKSTTLTLRFSITSP